MACEDTLRHLSHATSIMGVGCRIERSARTPRADELRALRGKLFSEWS